MTAVVATSTPGSGTAGPAPRWGTARTVLRLHRAALAVWAVAVVGLSGGLVWLTEVTARDARRAQEACDRVGQDFCDMTMGWVGYSGPVSLIGMVISYAFLAVAAFAGGALIGRELESGTAHLAWAQGITPTRWLTAKLAVPALLVTAGGTALVLVYRWSWGSNRTLLFNDWMSDDSYLSRGPAAVAYALCALALGALTALLLRRTLPALAVSVAASGLLSTVLAMNRHSFWPAVTATTSPTGDRDYPLSAWEVESGALIRGHRAPNFDDTQCYGDAPELMRHCLDDLGLTGFYTTYHPASHYWPLQLTETGIVLALAALATAAAFRVLRRRTA
jgi:hypothetical protein